MIGTDGDVHWLLGDSFEHIVHRIFNLLMEVNFADDVIEFMPALFELLCFIPVVRFSHCTPVSQESVMIFHPAATAAPATVVVVEQLFVVAASSRLSKCAVNSLLLGDADGVRCCLDGEGALKSRGDSKSPAGTAATLIFDCVHFVCVQRVISRSPVDSLRNIIESSATWTVHGQANVLVVIQFIYKTSPLLKFFRRHGGELVVDICESVGVIGIPLCIYCINDFVLPVVVLLLFKEIACPADIHVESGGVRQECLVVQKLGVDAASSASA